MGHSYYTSPHTCEFVQQRMELKELQKLWRGVGGLGRKVAHIHLRALLLLLYACNCTEIVFCWSQRPAGNFRRRQGILTCLWTLICVGPATGHSWLPCLLRLTCQVVCGERRWWGLVRTFHLFYLRNAIVRTYLSAPVCMCLCVCVGECLNVVKCDKLN